MKICVSYIDLWCLVEWCFQGCLEWSCLPHTWTACVSATVILSAGLLLVTCRYFSPPWWTLWLQSNVTLPWSTGSRVYGRDLRCIAISQFLMCPLAQDVGSEEKFPSLDWQELSGFYCFIWHLLLYGTLFSSWKYHVAWKFISSVQLKDVEKHVVDAFGVDAYYIIVCDFRKQNFTFLIPWHSLFVNALQANMCIKTE